MAAQLVTGTNCLAAMIYAIGLASFDATILEGNGRAGRNQSWLNERACMQN